MLCQLPAWLLLPTPAFHRQRRAHPPHTEAPSSPHPRRYKWYRGYEALHFPDPMGMRDKLERYSLGLYPASEWPASRTGRCGAQRPLPLLMLLVFKLAGRLLSCPGVTKSSATPCCLPLPAPPLVRLLALCSRLAGVPCMRPAALKWVMAAFDVPEAIAVGRTAMCGGGLAALTRLQAAGYYLGVLAYYWWGGGVEVGGGGRGVLCVCVAWCASRCDLGACCMVRCVRLQRRCRHACATGSWPLQAAAQLCSASARCRQGPCTSARRPAAAGCWPPPPWASSLAATCTSASTGEAGCGGGCCSGSCRCLTTVLCRHPQPPACLGAARAAAHRRGRLHTLCSKAPPRPQVEPLWACGSSSA